MITATHVATEALCVSILAAIAMFAASIRRHNAQRADRRHVNRTAANLFDAETEGER